MRKSLCVLVDRGPYGSLQAAEAIRHARGALGKGWEVVLVFLEDGAYALLPDQSPPPGEWVGLGEAVSDFMGEGQDRASVLVEHRALAARGLSVGALLPGVRPVSLQEVAEALASCDRTLVF